MGTNLLIVVARLTLQSPQQDTSANTSTAGPAADPLSSRWARNRAGFEYGTLRAPAFWAAQLDITPFGARVQPMIFLDAGQASQISRLFSTSALVGGGVGLSLFSGLI